MSSALPTLPGPVSRYSVYVAAQRPRTRRYWLHIALFLCTILSTLIVGMQLQTNFDAKLPIFSVEEMGFFPLLAVWQQPSRLVRGIPFSFTLLLILLAHEMGHYIACMRFRVDATLPYFVPAPTLIGTLGAFIRIRSPIPSRAALFDIGIAGPIAGFVVAVPSLAWGLSLSAVAPVLAQASDVQLGYPQIFHLLVPFVHHSGTMRGLDELYLHPVAIAAWVGMFATALNLLPGGQLDGGHIIYALWPRRHRKITILVVATLLVTSPFLWPGWLLWAVVLLSFGGRHPWVPHAPGLGWKRHGLGVFALFMFMLTFTPTPLPGRALDAHSVFSWLQSKLHLPNLR